MSAASQLRSIVRKKFAGETLQSIGDSIGISKSSAHTFLSLCGNSITIANYVKSQWPEYTETCDAAIDYWRSHRKAPARKPAINIDDYPSPYPQPRIPA